jgi:hypothetical protein
LSHREQTGACQIRAVSSRTSERGWIVPALANAVERFLEHRERVLERTAAGQPLERGGM